MAADNSRRAEAARSNPEGLICGYSLCPPHPPVPIELDAVAAAVERDTAVVWLHFSASNAAARRWLGQRVRAAAELLQLLEDHESRVQVRASGGSIVAVLNDLAFADKVDPSEIVTLWVMAGDRLLVTARNHASWSADMLRRQVRERLDAQSGTALLVRLLEIQLAGLREWLAGAANDLDQAEDRILIGDVAGQRQRLGQVRRDAMHLRRHFAPTRVALHRMLQAAADGQHGIDPATWRAVLDEFAFTIDDAVAVYERAKVLQEELASRLAEATSRNLYILTICTIVFLPMTLISGIFGMNVSGVPGVGADGAAAFWWVMALILMAGAVTFLLIRLRRFF